MHVQTLAVLRATPKPLLSKAMSQDNAPLKLSNILAYTSNWGVFELPRIPRHKQHIAHALMFVTLSLSGWEAFPMPRALIHTRITWALSPTTPQVLSVPPGSYLCHGVVSIPYGEVRDIHPHQTVSMLHFDHSSIVILYGVALCSSKGAIPTMHLQNWNSPKGVCPRWSVSNLRFIFQGPYVHWTHLLWDSLGLPLL